MGEIQPALHRSKDGTHFVVRSGVEADALGLIQCAISYIADDDGQIMVPSEFTKTEEQERAWIRSLRDNQNELLLVADYEGRIIGNIDFHIGKRQRTAHVGAFGMGIVNEWRSRGVGSALLGQLITWAWASKAVEKINLRVLANNQKAIGLYKKFGFTQEGYSVREIKIADGQYVDDLQMALFVGSESRRSPYIA